MDSMSPQHGTMGQNRSESLTRDSKPLPDSNKKKMKTLAQRRQSAPSLVISKALTRSRSASRDSSLTPVSPESCSLVQAFVAECLGRLFLGHVQTQLKTGLQTQERHLFLFTDTLLVAKAKSPTHFKVKAQVRVCEMWTASCMDEVCEGSTNPERSFVMGWPTCNCVAMFSSKELKDKWLALINNRINEGKERDDPKTIPLKIFAKDIGNCAYAKTLSVNNSDSTDDVIRMALQQFGISGCVKDHRLWVSSCRDDPPYPLIGHEFPFSIKMSHIRDGGSGVGGAGRDPMTPTNCPEVLLLDQCLPPDTQCQFILKPNKVVLGPPQLIEPAQQKSFKRKRSLINWPFWKGSNPQLDGLPLSPSLLSSAQGRLFGRPLNSVCSSDHGLPKPVMDMLGFLYLEGPYTRGIFRRSASAKACRELRDRLDSGAEDPEITHQSVFVIATVFKEFLRNVPDSLLCVDLYEQWMDVMEGEEGDERMSAVQRLLHLLPNENLLLLRHVIAVLHCIQSNAHDNQMNAFNLSVCIAPSMIWPPASSSPEVEGEATKKVCELVRFLIENCSTVLGDVTALFRDFSQKSSSDHGSDVSSFQMNDSSYDSLETELNDDPESPYQEQLPLRDKTKPDSRSRDSVITLSDGEPEPDPDSDLLLQLPPLFRPRRFSPAVRTPRASRQVSGLSQGPRRLRRSSEPALALANTPPSSAAVVSAEKRHCPVRKASYDVATEGEGEEEEDEVFLEQGLNALQLNEAGRDEQREASGGQRKMKHAPPPPLRLDASCSSLSSPATSPTGSSLSSLDSAFSQYSADYATNGAILQKSPRDSPPQKEALSLWQQSAQPSRTSHTSSHSHGLRPNMWLKKDRCLSLRQPDGGRVEELPVDNRTSCQAGDGNSISVQEAVVANPNCRQRCSSPPSYQQALLQLQRHRSPFYRETEKSLTIKELRKLSDRTKHTDSTSPKNAKPHTGSEVTQRPPESDRIQPPQSVFYGQSSTTLVLQRPKSHSLTPTVEGLKGREPLPRRASEPAKFAGDSNPSISLTLDKPSKSNLHDDRRRAPEVESKNPKQHLCLSPSAGRVVRDYFSTQGQADPDACLRRSREVALAIVQSKKEWQSRRCSDPRLEDFEKLFFAEESYV